MPLATFFASRRAPLWAGLAILLATLAALGNGLGGPFVFDDLPAIRDNATLRHWGSAWSPPPGALPVSGRPVLNLSFALNRALSGDAAWSYHAANLLIHALAGMTLFGIVRRTLRGAGPDAGAAAARDAAGEAARPGLLALAVALLWTVHPLQTESVTYISQRAESLMGLCYLLTLYSFIRYAEGPDGGPGRRPWAAAAVAACLLGMLTKEVMVSAPVLVLLYDRTFVGGSLREAWRRRRRLHLALAATWLGLVWSVASAGTTRGDTSGFAVRARAAGYWLTQFEAVVRYLRLALWPRPLVIYYEARWVQGPGEVLPAALVVIGLAAATAWALWRRPRAGFLGAWFFALLAPTSLVPNVIQMIAEHRMYLPLAAVVVAAVLGIFAWLGTRRGFFLCLALAGALALATVRRNEDYRSRREIWADTVAKRPANSFAHNNLGQALFEEGHYPEAIAEYREALRLTPDSIYAAVNLGAALETMGRLPEAIAAYRAAQRLRPDWASVADDLGDALIHAGRVREAIAQYQAALRLMPAYSQAENGLGTAFVRSGDVAAALPHFEAALRLNPDYAEAHNNLGTALASLSRLAEAVPHFQRAVELKPDYGEAHLNLGNAYYQANRLADAVHEYAESLRAGPATAETHDHFGILLAESGRLADAEEQFRQALRLQPNYAEAAENLARVLAAEQGRR